MLDIKNIGVLFFFFLLTACTTPTPQISAPAPQSDTPKNIILMIGDGMGLAQISAALYENENQLTLEKFPVVGFIKTSSYDNLVTDSGAGATAFACGVKTYNNGIGVGPDSLPRKNITEIAKENGLATGIVTSSSIVHATPAAFISHSTLRAFYEVIALGFLESDIDIFIGGGKKYFTDRAMDKRNIYKELVKNGYKISDYERTYLSKNLMNSNQKIGYFTAEKQPLSIKGGRDYLPSATSMAAESLVKRSKKGFFLMVEGAQIDWACHGKNGRLSIAETLDFDNAIANALEFARQNGETLVIVTADHETGGMAIDEKSNRKKIRPSFASNAHTGTMVPVFAYGPSAEKFVGIYENTDIFFKMIEALKLKNVPSTEASVPGLSKQDK